MARPTLDDDGRGGSRPQLETDVLHHVACVYAEVLASGAPRSVVERLSTLSDDGPFSSRLDALNDAVAARLNLPPARRASPEFQRLRAGAVLLLLHAPLLAAATAGEFRPATLPPHAVLAFNLRLHQSAIFDEAARLAAELFWGADLETVRRQLAWLREQIAAPVALAPLGRPDGAVRKLLMETGS